MNRIGSIGYVRLRLKRVYLFAGITHHDYRERKGGGSFVRTGRAWESDRWLYFPNAAQAVILAIGTCLHPLSNDSPNQSPHDILRLL
jgi:hypothetical protein